MTTNIKRNPIKTMLNLRLVTPLLPLRLASNALGSLSRLMLVASLGALVASPALAQKILLDRVIAIVDEDVVLQSEFDARLTDVTQNLQRANQPLPDEDELREEIMEALIIENLQMQFAERVSIRFDDDTLNGIINSMAEQANMSFDEYVNLLEENGVYRQTREQVRQQMTIRELQRGLVNSRIAITDQEIDNFLNSETGQEAIAAEYLVDHMLIPIVSEEPAESIDAKLRAAADIITTIEEGRPLGAVKQSLQQSGTLPITATEFGFRKAADLPSLFAETVLSMEVDDVAGPIRAGNGFHIIQLVQKRGGGEQIVNQTHMRHIMLTPNEIRNEEQTIAAINQLRQEIEDGANFATLARQNSDDATTVVAGGDLDWINDDLIPFEMAEALIGLEEGEVSEPFRTDSGWHILRLEGRQVADLSEDFVRQQAENMLRSRKFDLELQNWLIEIRDEAFVELID